MFFSDRRDNTVIETVLKTMFPTDRSDKTVTETVLKTMFLTSRSDETDTYPAPHWQKWQDRDRVDGGMQTEVALWARDKAALVYLMQSDHALSPWQSITAHIIMSCATGVSKSV